MSISPSLILIMVLALILAILLPEVIQVIPLQGRYIQRTHGLTTCLRATLLLILVIMQQCLRPRILCPQAFFEQSLRKQWSWLLELLIALYHTLLPTPFSFRPIDLDELLCHLSYFRGLKSPRRVSWLDENDCRTFFREISIPASNLLLQRDLLAGFIFGLYRWQNPRYRLAHSSKVFPNSKKASFPCVKPSSVSLS